MAAGVPRRFSMRLLLLPLLLTLAAGKGYGAAPVAVQSRFPGIELQVLGPARIVPLGDNTLLVGEGFTVTRAEMNPVLELRESPERNQLEKNLLFLLDQVAARKMLLVEAKKAGIPCEGKEEDRAIDELLKRKTSSVTVSDDEARAFFRANQELFNGAPFEQAGKDIRQYLLGEKKSQLAGSYISSLARSAPLRIDERWVERHARMAQDNPVDKARFSGKATMVEFGATGCIPCDKMQPILENLRRDYPGRLNVVFVHVRQEPILSARYGIRSIPIQAFFDDKGKEVFRHAGFFPEEEIVKQLSRMGISR